MITILVGDDRHAIEREIATYKTATFAPWRHFNFHRFNSRELEAAIACGRTAVFGEGNKVIVVEDCQFKQFGEAGLEILQYLSSLPETTHLIFTAASVDRRLKVCQHLLKHGKLKEFSLIPPWRTDLIASAIAAQARQINLSLSRETINYLAEAIGNDTARSASELDKLAVFANGSRIKLEQVKNLVPATTQTSLQLAEAVRLGQGTRIATLLQDLFARAEYPLIIVATLITQFRTWLWVKAALKGGINKDLEIAQLCGLGNPKRLYFLRQEVRDVSVGSLSQALTLLFDLEVALKSGATADSLLSALLKVSHLFQANSKTV